MASKVYRNKKISKHIRENIVCCILGTPNPAPHHIIGNGYSGMGTKAPDFLQMALHPSLHQELHDKGWKSFELKHGRTQKSMVAETLAKLHADRVIKMDELYLPCWVYEELEKIENE